MLGSASGERKKTKKSYIRLTAFFSCVYSCNCSYCCSCRKIANYFKFTEYRTINEWLIIVHKNECIYDSLVFSVERCRTATGICVQSTGNWNKSNAFTTVILITSIGGGKFVFQANRFKSTSFDFGISFANVYT